MRLPLGTRDVSESGGNAVLIARRGDAREPIGAVPMSLDEAIAALGARAVDTGVRFRPGETILWRYRRVLEVVRVISDDDDGLVVWLPSGSARLDAVPAVGGHVRDVPLDERFSSPWVTAESAWRGPGIVRVVPRGKPWSVWFFRDGAYVNLELPHTDVAATAGELGETQSEDLVLDLMIDAEHPGSEDVWLKDADELDAAVAQGRYSAAQRDAIRALADHALAELLADGAWPLARGWAAWDGAANDQTPLVLPDTDAVRAARLRRGATSHEG